MNEGTTEATVRLRSMDYAGETVASLKIALLPGKGSGIPAPLIDASRDEDADRSIPPVQLLEGAEYRYELHGITGSAVVLEPREIFQPDTDDGLTGRIRPGLHTGALRVTLQLDEKSLGHAVLEVRSRKLGYVNEYQWMLSDIADQMTELVMDRFGATSAQFVADESRDAVTLYQRFAFIRALINAEGFQNAINQILRRPHLAWEEQAVAIRPGQGMKGGSRLSRELVRPGPRTRGIDGVISTLPMQIESYRTEATHDTTPNRFVRFALEHWIQVIGEIERALRSDGRGGFAAERGLAEIAQLNEQLSEILHHELFRGLGSLARFPADDQVLQKRDGYRDVFRAYLEFELASKLSWSGGDDVYGAGQRDVATLYEYWVFMQIAKTVGALVGTSFDLVKLIETRADGLNVVLKTGKETVLSGLVERHGRRLQVDLCFNKRFGKQSSLYKTGSWSQAMRPDYSLIVTPIEVGPFGQEPILVHFDAKYRVSLLKEVFCDDALDERVAGKDEVFRAGPVRDDLLKMHAYRDAIRRSAGAYVIYPGDDAGQQFFEFHELLPGLGAFALRPTANGGAAGESALRTFISDVLDHVATKLTAHEHSRIYQAQLYDHPNQLSKPWPNGYVSELPLTTSVMLGWVKSRAHWDWISKHKSYNVRALGRHGGQSLDARVLCAQLVLLYGPGTSEPVLARITSDPRLLSEAGMSATGYPSPNGEYICLMIQLIDAKKWLQGVDQKRIEALASDTGAEIGEPVAVTWADVNRCRLGH